MSDFLKDHELLREYVQGFVGDEREWPFQDSRSFFGNGRMSVYRFLSMAFGPQLLQKKSK